jgi:hypothetical protein
MKKFNDPFLLFSQAPLPYAAVIRSSSRLFKSIRIITIKNIFSHIAITRMISGICHQIKTHSDGRKSRCSQSWARMISGAYNYKGYNLTDSQKKRLNVF